MDILKELFGTCDELQINKSLFGSEVGHVESLNMGLDHGLSSSREITQRPLPLLPDPRPPNPPPLLRSQSLDDLHTAPAGDDKDPLEMCRSDGFRPQSAFPQLIDSTATAHGMDLRNVPQEMPMYLLQEDEGNDEEIMRLLGTRNKPLPPFSAGGDFPNSTVNGGDVLAKSSQGSGGPHNNNQGDPSGTNGLIAEASSTNRLDETANQIEEDQEVGPIVPVGSPIDILGSLRVSETAQVSSDSSGLELLLPSAAGVSDSGAQESLPNCQNVGSSPLIDTGTTDLVSSTIRHTQVPHSDSAGQYHHSSSLSGAEAYGRVSGLRRKRKSRVSRARRTVMVNEGTQTLRAPTLRQSEVRVAVGSGQPASPSLTQREGSLRDRCGWSGSTQGNSLHPLHRSHREARPSPGQPPQMSTVRAVNQVPNIPDRSALPAQLKVSNTPARRSQSASPLTITQTSTLQQVCQSGTPYLHTSHSELAPQLSDVGTPQAGTSSGTAPSNHGTPNATMSHQKRSTLPSVLPPASQVAVCSIPPSTTKTAPVVQLPISTPCTTSGISAITAASASNQLPLSPPLTSSSVSRSLALSASSVPQCTTSPLVAPSPTPASTSGGLSVTTFSMATVQPLPAATSTMCTPFQSSFTPVPSRSIAPRLSIASSARTAASAFEHSIEALKRKVLIEAQKLDEALGSYQTHQPSGSMLGQPKPLPVTRTSPEVPSHPALQTTASTVCTVHASASHTLTASSAIGPQPAVVVQSSNSSETPAAVSPSLSKSPAVSTVLTRGHDSHLAVTSANSTTSSSPLSSISGLVISSIVSCAEDPSEQVHTPPPTDFSEEDQTAVLLNEEQEPPPDQTMDVEVEPAPVGEAPTEPVNSREKEDKMETAPGHADKNVAVEKLVAENDSEHSGLASLARSQQMDPQESAETTREDSQNSQLFKSAAPVSTSQAQPCFEPPTVTVCFPMVDWKTKQIHGTQLMGLSATPIQLLPTTNGVHSSQVGAGRKPSEEGKRKKLKRRHGGGWTKGKKRKIETEPRPPKPPSTGYGVFLAEKRASVQQETGCNSMSRISKMLGGMWTALTKEEKEEYYSKAEADKQRYLQELRSYLSKAAQGESSSTNLQLLDNFLSQSSENESNDDVLVCHMCKITFTSLYNKRSHYLGKIHSQTLVERLNKLLDCERLKQAGQGGKGREHQQLAPPPADHLPARSAHEDAAVASSSHDSDLVSQVGEVDLNNRPDNALSSSLYKEQLQTSTVGTCEEGAEPISGISSELNGENGPLVQEADSEHVAMETIETPGTLQCNSSPTVSKRVPTDLPLADHSTSSARSHFSEGSCDLGTCDMVSSYLHRCATAYQACVTQLHAERRQHSAALEEHAGLQQQVSELEHLESTQSEALTWLQSEERDLEQQVSQLLAVLENTGNTSTVGRMKSLLSTRGHSIRQ